ncbi:anti-sigma B factor antagonist [Ruminococcus sp. YRD2003]|uniref:STAS domain-containing protein n=1 Tax=Ruminococcus sp. YRD2003 TaxID=1452313 RepID=UPI0008C32FED|nr:anti-sigma B factor antagonist [Ruminococcus flavefaciens]
MNIEKISESGKLTLKLEGRIDTKSAPELDELVKTSLDGVTSLIIDLKEVAYISSAGLRVLLIAQKQMNKQGGMKIINVSEDIMEIFEVTGFSDILTIE